MRLATITALAMLGFAIPAAAQTVHRGSPAPDWSALPPPDDADDGDNAFFYPGDYDPQYGSEGRLLDATDFAASYGCLPVWDGKYSQYVEACNRD